MFFYKKKKKIDRIFISYMFKLYLFEIMDNKENSNCPFYQTRHIFFRCCFGFSTYIGLTSEFVESVMEDGIWTRVLTRIITRAHITKETVLKKKEKKNISKETNESKSLVFMKSVWLNSIIAKLVALFYGYMIQCLGTSRGGAPSLSPHHTLLQGPHT